MEPFDALATAGAEFRRRLVLVGPDDWDRPTPCDEWTVRDLVQHVVGGNRAWATALAGGTADEAAAARGRLGDDPLAEFDAGARAVEDGIRERGAVDRIVHHPAGDLRGQAVLVFRPTDLLVHAWDLARALGADDTLHPGCVAYVWSVLEPIAAKTGELGFFGSGASGALGSQASLQARVLDACGRRP